MPKLNLYLTYEYDQLIPEASNTKICYWHYEYAKHNSHLKRYKQLRDLYQCGYPQNAILHQIKLNTIETSIVTYG